MNKGEFTKANINTEEAIERIRNLQSGWHDLPLQGSQDTPRKVKVAFWTKENKMHLYVTEERGRREIEMAVIDLVTGEAIRGELGYAMRALNVIPRWDEE